MIQAIIITYLVYKKLVINKQKGAQKMIIYGIGKRGQALYKKCNDYKIRIEGFIDKRANDIDNSILLDPPRRN